MLPAGCTELQRHGFGCRSPCRGGLLGLLGDAAASESPVFLQVFSINSPTLPTRVDSIISLNRCQYPLRVGTKRCLPVCLQEKLHNNTDACLHSEPLPHHLNGVITGNHDWWPERGRMRQECLGRTERPQVEDECDKKHASREAGTLI